MDLSESLKINFRQSSFTLNCSQKAKQHSERISTLHNSSHPAKKMTQVRPADTAQWNEGQPEELNAALQPQKALGAV